MNVYIQSFDVFDETKMVDSEVAVVVDTAEEKVVIEEKDESLTVAETFAKILNTINILVIGYSVGSSNSYNYH